MKLKKKEQKFNPMRELLDRVSDDLEQKQVRLFTPEVGLNIDEEYLTLPFDLTDSTSVELGRHLNAFTQQRMYMRTLIGWQKGILEEKRIVYFDRSGGKYIDLAKQKSETSKERVLQSDPHISPYYQEYLSETIKLDTLEGALSSLDDGIFLISREISRRNSDLDTETRNDTVQSRKRGR